jgi:hypothetical protein
LVPTIAITDSAWLMRLLSAGWTARPVFSRTGQSAVLVAQKTSYPHGHHVVIYDVNT